MISDTKVVQYQSVAHRYIVCAPERGIFPISGDRVYIQLPSFCRVLSGSVEIDVAFDTMSILNVGVEKEPERYMTALELNKTGSYPMKHLPQKFVNSTNIIISFNNGNPTIGEATVRIVYEVDGRVHATR